MNYYMWTGGNNYGRWTGAAITQMYAVDALVCPDTLPHEPKFSSATRLHKAIAAAAASIANEQAQLDKFVQINSKVVAYVYNDVAFLENSDSNTHTVTFHGSSYSLPSWSSSLVNLTTGQTLVNSKDVAQPTTGRQIQDLAPRLLSDWKQWLEPILAADVPAGMYPPSSLFNTKTPLEMTLITSALSTFAFYETSIPAGAASGAVQPLTFQGTGATSYMVYLDGQYIGSEGDLSHSNGGTIVSKGLQFGPLAAGQKLTVLFEELGYANYGFTQRLQKGFVGYVKIGSTDITDNQWVQRGALGGEHLGIFTKENSSLVPWGPLSNTSRPGTLLVNTGI